MSEKVRDEAYYENKRKAGRAGGLARAANLGPEGLSAQARRMIGIRWGRCITKPPRVKGGKRGRPRKLKPEIIGGELSP